MRDGLLSFAILRFFACVLVGFFTIALFYLSLFALFTLRTLLTFLILFALFTFFTRAIFSFVIGGAFWDVGEIGFDVGFGCLGGIGLS